MFTYEEAKKFAVDNLLRDAELHEAGDYQRVGDNFDEYDAELPRTDDLRFTKLHIALNFWDGWQDSRNHDWIFYGGIEKDDWPRLARIIIKDITEEQEITEGIILKHFNLRQPREGMISKLRKFFRKKSDA
jgi:hypothetical protein